MPSHTFRIAVVTLLFLSLGSRPLQAQIINPPQPANPILPRPSLSPQLPSPQLPSPLEVPPSIGPSRPETPKGIKGTIQISKFVFYGNQAISNQQLEKVVAPYIGRRISVAEFQQALEAINKLYVNAGYITSGAFLPASRNLQLQSAQNTVATVRVIEGSIEQINVTGSDRLQNYVRARLERGIFPALNENRLLEALRLLRDDPLIQSISAKLSPGSRVGQSILDVRVTPQQPLSLQAGLNNTRSPAVGSLERRLSFTHANLLGQGDRLSFTYRNTDGSNAGEGSYTIPFNVQGGTVGFDTTALDSTIVEQPFSQLDILSDFRSYKLTVRQPFMRTATERSAQEFALGLTASREESKASLLGIPFALSIGADEQGRTRISALRFFQEYSLQGSQQALALRSQFSFGLNAFGSTINPQLPDSQFFAWRGDGQYVRVLSPDFPLLIRWGVQVADRSLVPIEQLGIGGSDTVRGYRKDLLLASSGGFASVEARVPLFRSSSLPGLLQIAPFLDFGASFDDRQELNLSQNQFLASIGLGLEWQMEERFIARLDYGIPLVSATSQGDSLQEQGFTFSILYNPL